MDKSSFWKSLLKKHENPCYIRDTKTEEVLYANEKLIDMFGFSDQIIGSCYREIILADDSVYDDIKENWTLRDEYTFGFHHKGLQENLCVSAVLSDDKQTVFGELIQCNQLESTMTFDEAMTKCIEIYQQPTETVVKSLMELLCDFYQCERAYVYRVDEKESLLTCVDMCCHNSDYNVFTEVTKEMNSPVLIEWVKTITDQGIVMANTEDESFDQQSPLGQLFQRFEMKNFSVCTVKDTNKEIIGFVGITNRANYSQLLDTRLLKTISHFVVTEVTENQLDITLSDIHYKDGMTGVYSRVAYAKVINEFLENAPKTMGIISVNVNGLKEINTNLGIDAGDRHIKKCVETLEQKFSYRFYRLSGDEFIGLALDVDKNEFEDKVSQLVDHMRSTKNYDFSVGHSWGQGNYNYASLVQEADVRMYINKQEYYAATKRTYDNVSNAVLSDLLAHLSNDEFMIYLQPQLYLKDGSLYGAEALIRRYDKTNQKMVFPDQFIPLYEKNSVIRHVDLFVVDAVCKLLAKWNQAGKAIPVSVNLSRVTLQEYGIVEAITKICDKHQVPHNLVVIEVTERVGLIENKVASTLINEFKDHGFHISLDDFGCAYSNIITLAQIDVDEVKLDKSLVDDLTSNRKNHILVKNVLSMCEELEGMSTLAEGIEDNEQAMLLRDLGCHLGQGYFYSRPIPVPEFSDKYI